MAIKHMECARCMLLPTKTVAAVRILPDCILTGLCGQHLDEVQIEVDMYGTMYEASNEKD